MDEIDKSNSSIKIEKREVKIIYIITEKDWLEINKLFYKIYGKKRKIFLWLMTALTFILFIYRTYTVYELYINNINRFQTIGSLNKYLVNVGLLFIIFLWMLWLNVIDDRRGIKKSYRMNKAVLAECELTFDDEGAISKRESTFKKYILIMFTRNQGYFLKREDIAKDDIETLMSIINYNCDGKVQVFDK